VARHAQQVQAFVIACFSDPGVQAARAATDKPVVGLGESGLRAALAQGRRVGVVAVADAAIPRHLRYWKALGLESQVAGERAVNLRVDQSGDPLLAFQPMCDAGRRLRDEDGADVLLLGCAGMGGLRERLQQALGMPVVDPCQAAAEAAAAALGYGAKE
jgi:Asp/Glu/hydantoin racemase